MVVFIVDVVDRLMMMVVWVQKLFVINKFFFILIKEKKIQKIDVFVDYYYCLQLVGFEFYYG